MLSLFEKRPITSLLILTAVMLGLGFPHLDVTIMEARNFITAREMIDDGNWLLTTMNGEPRYQKPPLPTWFAAIFGWLFGWKNVILIRLPGILMVALTGIIGYLFSKKITQEIRLSFLIGLITISSLYVFAIVIEAPWDIFTHAFMYFGIYHLFKLLEKSSKYWKHTLMAALGIGLSILCKGPISIYALLLPFLLAYGFSIKYKSFKSKAFSLFSVLLLGLVIGGWWYLYVRLADPETFVAITEKETQNWSSYNVRPFYYYWSFFVQSGLWTIPAFVSLLYPYLKNKVRFKKEYKLSFLWTIFAVVLLSIIPEKKSRYLMPVLIPLALNIGFYLDYVIREFKIFKTKKEVLPIYFHFGLISLIGLLFPLSIVQLYQDIEGISWVYFGIAALSLPLISVLIIKNLKLKRIQYCSILSVFFLIVSFICLLPLGKTQWAENYRSIDKLRDSILESKMELRSIGQVSPEIIWQYGDKIIPIEPDELILNSDLFNSFGLIISASRVDELNQLENYYEIENSGYFDLNRNQENERGYRKRLKVDYFVLTLKTNPSLR